MRVIFEYENRGTGYIDDETGMGYYWLHQLVETSDFEMRWTKTKIHYCVFDMVA